MPRPYDERARTAQDAAGRVDQPAEAAPAPFDLASFDLAPLDLALRLAEVGAALAEALTASDVKQVILTQIVPLTGAAAGTIVREVDGQTLLVFGAAGYDDHTQLAWQRQAAGGTFPVTVALREERPVFASRAEAERDYPDLAPLLRHDTRAVAAVPLIAGGRVLAGLTLSFQGEGVLGPERQAFITQVAGYAARALARARAFDAEHHARERAALLAEAGTVLAASLDVQQTLERLMALAITHVADWAAVYLPDEQGVPTPVAVAHRDPELVELLRWFVAQYPADSQSPGSTAWVMRTGESFLLPAVPPALIEQIRDPERRAAIKRMGFHSLIHVPLTAQGRAVGVLGLATSQPQRTYGADDLTLAQQLAARAALALENAREYQATRIAEDRYRSLVDATRQTVWTADPSGELHGEQPGWTALTGQPRDEYRGLGWAERLHPEDRQRSVGAWQATVAARASYDVQHRVRVTDGTYRHFHSRAVPVLDNAGEVREWVGVSTDVSEQTEAQARLRQSEERLRRLVEASPVGIVVGARDGTLLFPNDAFLRLHGHPREAFDAGMLNWAKLTPPEDHAADERALGQALERGTSEPYEKEMLRRDGTRFPAGLVLTRYEQGDETFVVGYVQDLTLQKAAERTLRDHSADLERRVAEHTRALDEQRAALDAFVRFTELAATTTSLQDLTRHAAEVLRATIGPVSVAYYELQGDLWKAVTWSEDIPEEALAMIRAGVARAQPSFAQVVRERQAYYMEEWDAQREQLGDSGMYGAGALYPFFSEGEPCGLLNMASFTLRRWSEQDKAIFQAVGRSFALALERSEQTTRLQTQKLELDARPGARGLRGLHA